jgi:hypothetical protein
MVIRFLEAAQICIFTTAFILALPPNSDLKPAHYPVINTLSLATNQPRYGSAN